MNHSIVKDHAFSCVNYYSFLHFVIQKRAS